MSEEIEFLKELSALLKKHNANFEMSCEGCRSHLYFDIDGVSYGNEIATNVGGCKDICSDDIDKIVTKLEKGGD